jgi:large subunit ribosomal protein L21
MKVIISLQISRLVLDMKTLIDLTAGLIGIAFDEISGVSKDGSLPDDLTKINGIGSAYAGRLNEAGITTFSQLAELSADQVRELMKLSESQGNPEMWIEQAKDLS